MRPPRRRQARLTATDARGKTWNIRWHPSDQLFTLREHRSTVELIVTAAQLIELANPQPNLFPEE